jgi:hypothetical protein
VILVTREPVQGGVTKRRGVVRVSMPFQRDALKRAIELVIATGPRRPAR